MAHVLRHLAPIFLMCDPRDLQAVAQVRSPFTERPTLFLYENQPGGVGMAPRLFEIHAHLLKAARELVERCRCDGGCPGCVGPSIGDHGANKRAALVLLGRLCVDERPDGTAEARRRGEAPGRVDQDPAMAVTAGAATAARR
jgi:DEAD/DEAH box helicase domain-containing protein